MNYPKLFKDSWKLLWSNWRIWFFSLLMLAAGRLPSSNDSDDYVIICLYLLLSLPVIFLPTIGEAGIIQSTKRQIEGATLSLKETWDYVKPNLIRLFITNLLIGIASLILIYLPRWLIGLVELSTLIHSVISGAITVYISPFLSLIFVAVVVRQTKIFEALKHAQSVVSINLAQLLVISLTLYLFRPIYQQASAIITLAIQTGFSIEGMNTFYFGMYSDLKGSPILLILDQIYALVFTPLSLTVYTLAYLQFTKKNTSRNNIPAAV